MPSAPAWPNCFHDRSLRSLSALLWAGGGAAELSMGLASVGRYDRPAESYVLSKVSLSLSLSASSASFVARHVLHSL